MATNHPPFPSFKLNNNNNAAEEEEEDYIDMELATSCSNCSTTSSSPKSREFEFQMGTISIDKEKTTSPADELFYRGKLLPLHLPPRLEMFQKLLHSSNLESFQLQNQESNLMSSTNSTSTPLDQSRSISPSESCRVSCELNPDEYFFEWSTEFSTFIHDHPKKSWSKKLKQSLITQKIKALNNLKSLFTKSTCSDQETKVVTSKKTPFGKNTTIASVIEGEDSNNIVNSHRRSFSAAIKKHSPTKCLSSSSSSNNSSSSSSSATSSSSSSFSMNSSGFYELNLLKRSSSVTTTEIDEGSIEAAIAHCKKSQELCNPRKKLNTSLSISKIAERPDLCRF